MTAGVLSVDYPAAQAAANDLPRYAEQVGRLVPRVLAGLAYTGLVAAGLDLLPLVGLLGGSALLLDVGGWCGLAGLPHAAAALDGLAGRLLAAVSGYRAVDGFLAGRSAVLPCAGSAGLVAVSPVIGAVGMVAVWDVEHRFLPPGLGPATDRLLDGLDLTVDGPASVHEVAAVGQGERGIHPAALRAAARSPAAALRTITALSTPRSPSTYAVVQTSAGPPPRYVVCLPGLQHWTGSDSSAADLPGAIATLTGHSSYVSGVREQLARLPAGSEVTVVGHSQGGMVGEALAADPTLRAAHIHVTGLLTAGSPRLADSPPPDVSYLALENDHDPIPALRDVATGLVFPAIPEQPDPQRVVVRFPAPRPGLLANHGLAGGGYLAEAASPDPRVAAFREHTAPFFTGHAVAVHVYQVTDCGAGGQP